MNAFKLCAGLPFLIVGVAAASPPSKEAPFPEVRDVINAHRDDILGCYEARKRTDPSLKGAVLITWSVAVDGTAAIRFGRDLEATLGTPPADAGDTSGGNTGDKTGDKTGDPLVDDVGLQTCVRALPWRFPAAAIKHDGAQNAARVVTVPYLFGVPSLPKPVVRAAEGIAVAETGGLNILALAMQPCRPLLPSTPGPMLLDWRRVDGADSVIVVAGDARFMACVVEKAKTWKPTHWGKNAVVHIELVPAP